MGVNAASLLCLKILTGEHPSHGDYLRHSTKKQAVSARTDSAN